MATNSILLAALAVSKPVAVGIGLAALIGIWLAFKVAKFVIKMLLVLAALTAIGLAVWWYYTAHHGSF
ncbi:MAG: hypothetical protein EXS35_12840 [Pedosphaera sp.]|nr:hypothetical protein [Pedosphaera sp.]